MDAFRNTQRPFVAPKPPKTPKTVKPKAPRITRPKLPDPNKIASDQAMSAFRQALAQLQQVTPQVDQAAIRAPYQAASVATGQLGGGLQAALLQSGQAAQSQYTAGLGQAQQQAAQFGISAGAGANPTALVNNGSQLIAQQTQAQAAAAPQAATAWQQLLERTAAARVSDAQLGRSNLISSAQAQLAGNIPSMIADEKDRGFRAQTQRENMGLARSQLTAKQRADLLDYTLGAAKVGQSAKSATVKAAQTDAKLAETKQHNRTTETIAAKKLAQSKKAAQKKATASGVKGISALNSALKTTSTKGEKPVIGHTVTYPTNPNGVSAGAPALEVYVPAGKKPKPPSGYLAPLNEGKPVLGQAKAGASSSLTRSRWNQLFSQLKAANRGLGFTDAQLMQSMPPRPKK